MEYLPSLYDAHITWGLAAKEKTFREARTEVAARLEPDRVKTSEFDGRVGWTMSRPVVLSPEKTVEKDAVGHALPVMASQDADVEMDLDIFMRDTELKKYQPSTAFWVPVADMPPVSKPLVAGGSAKSGAEAIMSNWKDFRRHWRTLIWCALGQDIQSWQDEVDLNVVTGDSLGYGLLTA